MSVFQHDFLIIGAELAELRAAVAAQLQGVDADKDSYPLETGGEGLLGSER